MYTVTIGTEPARALAVLEHRGPYPQIGPVFEAVSAAVVKDDLWMQVRGMVGIFLDDPDTTAPEDLRSYAGVILANGALPEGLQRYDLSGGKVAKLRHIGPYSDLHAIYGYLYGTWMQETGETPSDQPSYEVYYNGPADTAPKDLVTDICIPLR